MKNTLMKQVLSLLMLVVIIGSLAVPVAAASSVSIDETAKEALPIQSGISIRSYGQKNSGTIKCFTNESLSTRGTAWIDLKTDECYITRVANNGKALYIKFPIGGNKYLSRWFSAAEFLGVNVASEFPVYNVTQKMTTYRRSNGGAQYGYAGVGDKIYLLSMNQNYVCILYPLTSAGQYKIGYVKHTTFQNCAEIIHSDLSTSSTFVHPMSNYHTRFTQWNDRPGYRSGAARQYHVGVDYSSATDSNIYAFGAGKVVSYGYQQANGNFILIEHQIPNQSGKLQTVYSFYGHLDVIYVKNGQKVSAGTVIGKMGKTGSSAGNVEHLHFAIIDYCWKSGGVYGYTTKFSGNKVTYQNVTYYNPYYVIQNGSLC